MLLLFSSIAASLFNKLTYYLLTYLLTLLRTVGGSANTYMTIGDDVLRVMGLLQLRYEHDSSTIRLQHATTRYEVFRALAYEIVYENQW